MRARLALPLRMRVIQPLILLRREHRSQTGLVFFQAAIRSILPRLYSIHAAVPYLALHRRDLIRVSRIQTQHALCEAGVRVLNFFEAVDQRPVILVSDCILSVFVEGLGFRV